MARRASVDDERERSPRKARVCVKCQARSFGRLDWECPDHPGQTIDQPDAPYLGVVPKLAPKR